MHKIDIKEKKGWSVPGAKIIPQIEVKIARDITLGFSKEMKSLSELSFAEKVSGLYLAYFVCKIYLHILLAITLPSVSHQMSGMVEVN